MSHKYIRPLAMIFPILLAVICLVQVIINNNQASMPVPKEESFSGEYSYNGKDWYPYHEDSAISAFDGEVIVKGHLEDGIEEGGVLNFFCNHIGVSIYVNGELLYMDMPTELKNYGIDLMPSMCGKRWEQILCPKITSEDEIEFHFMNYHKHGNKNAYKETLSSLLITPIDNTILEVYLKSYIKPFQMAGYALLIVAAMLLGASLSAIFFKSTMVHRLFKIGITTLFVGGYMVFDVMMVYFTDELLAMKTYGRQLCLMLSVYFMGTMVCDRLKEKYKKAAENIMRVSFIVNIFILVCVVFGKVLLYDTLFFWESVQYLIGILLILLCVLELKREKKYSMDLILYVGMNIALFFDNAGISYGRYYSGMCFKAAYMFAIILFLSDGAKQVILDHQASVKNKKLKAELEQSRIAIMLSQIQPHFLYNSLTCVMDLCDTDPKQAKAAVADFADYLRGNLSSLKTENLISFRIELEHIEKYLRLEKLRFQEELEVVYDIQAKDFMLPALSVQPLIENAVKHGVGCKIGGGTVWIHTYESEEDYKICIRDNGVGFEDGECVEKKGSHIGIENTRKRLEMMADAGLEIESKKGEGTTVRIRIPKRGDKDVYSCGR